MNLPGAASPSSGKPLFSDWLFIGCMALAMAGVFWVGNHAYQQGLNTEHLKRHGERWGRFLAAQASLRAQDNYPLAACAAKPDVKTTWGECYQSLVAPGGPMDGITNPFTLAPQRLATQCDPKSRELVGALVVEKITPTAAGSPVPLTFTALGENDVLNSTMHLRITVCDKAANALRVGEFEF